MVPASHDVNETDWTASEPIGIETIVDYRSYPHRSVFCYLKDDVQIAAHFRSRGHG